MSKLSHIYSHGALSFNEIVLRFVLRSLNELFFFFFFFFADEITLHLEKMSYLTNI